jgi:predicted RNA-binding protein with PIN domain
MKLLVDGYNLLHASGVFGQPSDPPTLETARRALLALLAAQLTDRERRRATIVFDGKEAPPGLPSESSYQQISVVFSRRKTTADELIAEMIAAEKQPKQLVVVSSDHSVQRSARQRGVTFHDSEAWLRTMQQRQSSTAAPAESRDHVPSADEVASWLQEFSESKDSPRTRPGPPRSTRLKKP